MCGFFQYVMQNAKKEVEESIVKAENICSQPIVLFTHPKYYWHKRLVRQYLCTSRPRVGVQS